MIERSTRCFMCRSLARRCELAIPMVFGENSQKCGPPEGRPLEGESADQGSTAGDDDGVDDVNNTVRGLAA